MCVSLFFVLSLLHIVDCLAGEQQVLVTENRVVDGQLVVEVVPRCSACPLNSYQDKVGGGDCKLCPLDHITLMRGSTSSKDCIGKS